MNETTKDAAVFASHATIIVAIVGASWSLSDSMATLAGKVDRNTEAIGRLEQRIDQVEEKLDQMGEKLDRLAGQFTEHVRQHPTIAAVIGPESQGG